MQWKLLQQKAWIVAGLSALAVHPGPPLGRLRPVTDLKQKWSMASKFTGGCVSSHEFPGFCGPPMRACVHTEYYLRRRFAACLNSLARHITDKSSILLESNAWIQSGN